MPYRIAADLLVVLHLGFVVFVVLGGLLAWRWRHIAWVHLPAAVWGVLIEFAGWVCPLTPLEQRWRLLAGQAGYDGGFVEHYVIPVVYPAGLTRGLQYALGSAVLIVNLFAYSVYFFGRRRSRREQDSSPHQTSR